MGEATQIEGSTVGGANTWDRRLPDADLPFHEGEMERLRGLLAEASEQSSLPDRPAGAPALSDLLLRLRLPGSHA